MAETSTIRADSPTCERSADGGAHRGEPLKALIIPAGKEASRTLLPSMSIRPTDEVKDPALFKSRYEALLLRLQQDRWEEGAGVSGSHLGSTEIIKFYSHRSYIMPRAVISDTKLEMELMAWSRLGISDTDAPRETQFYPANDLLMIFTKFTRERGHTPSRNHVTVALQAICIGVLEQFQSPTMYRRKVAHPSYYWTIFLNLNYHRNCLALIGSNTGPLSSFESSPDHLTLSIQPLHGIPITWRLTWQQAIDPSSILHSFPPLFRRALTGDGPSTEPRATPDVQIERASATNGDDPHSNVGSVQGADGRQSARDMRRAKRRRNVSDRTSTRKGVKHREGPQRNAEA